MRGIVKSKQVQHIVATIEQKAPRPVESLPGRIILEDGEHALAKDSTGDSFYVLEKIDRDWKCGCAGYKYKNRCKHVTGLQAYLNKHRSIESASGIKSGAFQPCTE